MTEFDAIEQGWFKDPFGYWINPARTGESFERLSDIPDDGEMDPLDMGDDDDHR